MFESAAMRGIWMRANERLGARPGHVDMAGSRVSLDEEHVAFFREHATRKERGVTREHRHRRTRIGTKQPPRIAEQLEFGRPFTICRRRCRLGESALRRRAFLESFGDVALPFRVLGTMTISAPIPLR